MRIAVNTQLLLPNKLEGIGWFAHETLRRITTAHPEHEFLFIFDRPWDASFIYSSNVIPVSTMVPSRHPFLWYWHYEIDTPLILKKYKPDLYFSPDGWMPLRSRIPVVDVIHDVNFMLRQQDFPKLVIDYYLRYFPKFAQKAKKIITVSEFSKNDIATYMQVDKQKIEVCYNGCNTMYTPIPSEVKVEMRNRFSDGKPYFVYVGSLNPRKNIEGMFNAFDSFKKETGCEHKLVVVGENMRRNADYQERLGKLQYGDDILFTGRLSSEVLHLVIASACSLLLFSFYEGFGIPIVEAMNCDVPVLCSNVSSMPEVAGKAALLVDPTSIESMAGAMETVGMNEDIRAKLIEEGRIQRQMFSWDLTAQRVWNVIEKELQK